MSSSVDIDNKNKDILILGEGILLGLDDTISTTGRKYSINFNTTKKRICIKSTL